MGDAGGNTPADIGEMSHPAPIEHATDLELARSAGLGDRAAFAVIFDRHAAAMFRYAVNMLDGDQDAAEDTVQDALERAWANLPGFRGDAQLRTWLFRITANVVLSARRRRRPIAVDDELLTALPATPEAEPVQQVQDSELRAALELALTELPWRQRAAWLLREMEGLSYDEIADVLQTSPAVVRGQLHRARGTLAVRMVQWR
ncbi:RNA polymerase sigma factor [Pengzhenrongella phosphoraccumulans]|uniref:RNA polymerase sigma factor n=1 Tax=Pengzhenrongella phosphoraccumulans TaxID=3114394 RepID=UPI003890FC65